jgi:hypothetical protein
MLQLSDDLVSTFRPGRGLRLADRLGIFQELSHGIPIFSLCRPGLHVCVLR